MILYSEIKSLHETTRTASHVEPSTYHPIPLVAVRRALTAEQWEFLLWVSEAALPHEYIWNKIN
jgi:hypothetical protein